MMEVGVTTGATRHAKLESTCHHQETNTKYFTSCRPNHSVVKALKGKLAKIMINNKFF